MRTIIYSLVFLYTSLFATLQEKSAVVYYEDKISYPMVGIHDYIIVQPELTNTHTHGFSLYNDKMYAYVSIGEIDKKIKEYQDIKQEWVVAKNDSWQSEVLDLKNKEYIEYLFSAMIQPRVNQGFTNFFFDTLDSYHLASKTQEDREANEKALVSFLKEFKRRYPNSKLVINRGFEIIDQVHDLVDAVLFESYYVGIGGDKLAYKNVDSEAREWLDIHIDKIKSYGVDVISVEYLPEDEVDAADEVVGKLVKRGIIPYVSNRELNIYGKSSKNAIKREIFTLINEERLDRTLTEAHQHGGLVIEYLGYIEKLYDINDGLPSLNDMRHYAGVVIWLHDVVDNPLEFIKWVKSLDTIGLKVVFISNFGIGQADEVLELIDVKKTKGLVQKKEIIHQDKMIPFEIDPSMSLVHKSYKSKNIKPLLTYENTDGTKSTPGAITSWGGYIVEQAFMQGIEKEFLWVTNPFKFFEEGLRLEKLVVPDVTTENGKRLFFTHIDGDGIMNKVEGKPDLFSGDVILEEILKPYKVPHSVSLVGAEIRPDGLYPQLSEKMLQISKDMFALENVEGATHTFTHPFKWGKIQNNQLSQEYRLKVKDYNFSLEHELVDSIEYLNDNLSSENTKHIQTVFWSGDCTPRENALEVIYQNNLLNINGGDTLITRTKPWLSYVGPLGVERGEYYQVYTGAQNENVFTNDWLGPYWGFKKVVQTFQMTDSPRRLKPIDIYYHLYSGSKMASLKALKFVFDWSLKQEVMPIFTSEYIPKVLDFYTASMAKDGDDWLVDGLRDLKTIRIEKENAAVDFINSNSTVGLKHFENHTYLSLDQGTKHQLRVANNEDYKKETYLISSNAKLVDYNQNEKSKKFLFEGHVDLKLSFNIGEGCRLQVKPKPLKKIEFANKVNYYFRDEKKATVESICK